MTIEQLTSKERLTLCNGSQLIDVGDEVAACPGCADCEPDPMPPKHDATMPTVWLYLLAAARQLVEKVDQNHGEKGPPLKWNVPWAQVTALRDAVLKAGMEHDRAADEPCALPVSRELLDEIAYQHKDSNKFERARESLIAILKGASPPPTALPAEAREVIEAFLQQGDFSSPHWLGEKARALQMLGGLYAETKSEFCPHGMPLAENICGPCSQGRPNRAPVETSAVCQCHHIPRRAIDGNKCLRCGLPVSEEASHDQ